MAATFVCSVIFLFVVYFAMLALCHQSFFRPVLSHSQMATPIYTCSLFHQWKLQLRYLSAPVLKFAQLPYNQNFACAYLFVRMILCKSFVATSPRLLLFIKFKGCPRPVCAAVCIRESILI